MLGLRPPMAKEHTPKRGRHFYGPGPYVEREADQTLVEALRAGEYALVLAPRGSGKTSLRIRTSELLTDAGVSVAAVDLGAIGAENRADAFCASVVIEAGRSLGLAEQAKQAWRASKGPPQMRLRACIREVILEQVDGPVVLFIDELELVRALGPARDDFFAALRAMADARGEAGPWGRLSVCLVGALTRDELVSDPRRSAFDLPAREIGLRDFSREQLDAFAPTLEPLGADTKALLDALNDWTSGHPALCQWIAGDLLLREVQKGDEATAVEAVVRESFLQRGPEVDPLLGDTARRLRRDQRDPWRTRVLAVYERVLRGERIDLRGRQLGSDGALIVARLKIAGLVAASAGGKLRVRNKVVERAFDRNWVRKALAGRPVSEALERWESGGRRSAALLRGQDLREAVAWVEGRPDVTPGERDFVLASERARAHRLRRLLFAGSALSLGLAGLLGVSLWQYRASLEAPTARGVVAAGLETKAARASSSGELVDPPKADDLSLVETIAAVDQASRLDLQIQQNELLRGQLEVQTQRLAIEQASRAELLAPDPGRRTEGASLALRALEHWAEDLGEAPAAVTRALTINLPAAGDTIEVDAHGGPIVALASSPTRAVTVALKTVTDNGDAPPPTTGGAEVRVWELATGRRLASLETPAGELEAVAISPSGLWIAALSRTGSLTVWSLDELDELATFGPAPVPAPAGVLTGLAPVASLSVDDSGGVSLLRRDGAVDRVDPQAGNASARVRGSALPDELPLSHAAARVPPAGSETTAPASVALLAANTLELWDPPTGRTLASIPAPPFPTGVRELLWHPDGRRVLVWPHAGRSLLEWSIDSGELSQQTEHESAITAARFSPGGLLMATGTQAGAVRLWSTEGALLAEAPAHAAPVSALSFGRGTLVSADRSGGLRIQPLTRHDRPEPQAAQLGPDGAVLTVAMRVAVQANQATATAVPTLWLDGLDRLGLLPPRPLPPGTVRVETDLDARVLALVLDDGRAGLLSLNPELGGAPTPNDEAAPEPELPNFLPFPTAPGEASSSRVLDLLVSPDGERIILATEDRRVTLWGADRTPIATLAGHQAPVDRLALSPSGQYLASADRSQVVRVWDPGTAALWATLESDHEAHHLVLNDRFLLLVDHAGEAELWSLETRERVDELSLGQTSHADGPIQRVALSGDGSRLALARGRAVELWRLDTGEAIGRFRVQPPVLSLRFGEGGELLAVDGRGIVARWSTDVGQWLLEACDALPVGTVLPAVCPVDG